MNTKVAPKNSIAFSQAEADGVSLALSEILSKRKKLESQGMSQLSFFLGVMNVGLTVWVISVYPQYYWIVFLSKFAIMLPTRLYLGVKGKDNYYLLDFCWVSCTSVFICFLLVATGAFDPNTTRQAMRILFTFSVGPQGWSVIIFSNSLVLHSIMHTCSVFIHLSPVMLCYTIRWNLGKLNDAFPELFPLGNNMLTDDLIGDLYLPALIAYSCWFALYSIWLCFHGLGLPAKGQDTVWNWLYTTKPPFRNFIDTIAYKLFKQEKKKQTKGKVMIFMVTHLLMISTTMWWALLCYEYEWVHLLFIILLCACVVWKASSYYTFLTLNAPKRTLEKLIEQINQQFPDSKSKNYTDGLNNEIEKQDKQIGKYDLKADVEAQGNFEDLVEKQPAEPTTTNNNIS